MVAAVIFTLIDVKDKSDSKQQQPCYFCYDHFFESGLAFCGGIISFLNIIVECYHMECYHMECSLFPMRPIFNLLSRFEIYFQTSLSVGIEVIYENLSHLPEYLQSHVSSILTAHLLSWKYYQIGQR